MEVTGPLLTMARGKSKALADVLIVYSNKKCADQNAL